MSYWYIPLADETKRPVTEFGGWPIDPTRPGVFSREEIDEIDHDNWAVVGSDTRNLLIIDIDLYKMDESTKEAIEYGWYGLLDETRIVKTQSGGLHVYFYYDGDNLPPSIEYVDIKGDVGKGYAVAPFSPGYELSNDRDPVQISEDLVERLPVFKDRIEERDSSELDFVKQNVYMTNVPPCYHVIVDELGQDEFADKFIVDYHRMKGHEEEILDHVFQEYYPNGNWRQALKGVRTDSIRVHDVVSKSYEEGVRYEHPSFLHSSPSESQANFMVDDGGETFRCWRHDVTGNAFHLLGVKGGIISCGEWKNRKLDADTWAEIFQYAKDQGFDVSETTIDCQDVMDAGFCPYNCDRLTPFL